MRGGGAIIMSVYGSGSHVSTHSLVPQKDKKREIERESNRLSEGFCGRDCQTDSWGSTGQTMRDVILDQVAGTSAIE